MRIYLAGNAGTHSREKIWRKLIRNRLVSFWDVSKDKTFAEFILKLWSNEKK